MSENKKVKIEVKDETAQTPEDPENITQGDASAPGEDPSGGNTVTPPPGDDALELGKAKEEAKQAYDKYLRVSAEFENYKKRMARETDEFKKYANESLIAALLPVIDNLERAIQSAKSEANNTASLVQGVELTLNEIIKVFTRYQVSQIEALGKPFDPNYHQAMLQETSDEHPDNTILQELQKGYTLHNRLLRPAMVVVSKTTDK